MKRAILTSTLALMALVGICAQKNIVWEHPVIGAICVRF